MFGILACKRNAERNRAEYEIAVHGACAMPGSSVNDFVTEHGCQFGLVFQFLSEDRG